MEVILDGNNKKWPKSLPRITDQSVAVQVGELLLQAQFFHRSEKVGEKKGYLKVRVMLEIFWSTQVLTMNLSLRFVFRYAAIICSKRKVIIHGCMLVI